MNGQDSAHGASHNGTVHPEDTQRVARGLTSLLSNLLKVRNETVKNAISNV